MKVPDLLAGGRRAEALEVLSCYYRRGRHGAHRPFTGSWFDTWDSTGTRHLDADRFTADDLVAVSFLSVEVPPAAALELLDARAGEFAGLLERLGPDRDLATQTRRWATGSAGRCGSS